MITVTKLILNREDGMTLTELTVALALTGVVLATAYLLLATGSRIVDSLQARDAAVSEGRIAMDRLTREIRQAYEASDGTGAFAVNQPRCCSFYVDLNHDRLPERLTYYVQGNQLLRTMATPTTIVPPYSFGAESSPVVIVSNLSSGWSGSMFTYYNDTSSVVASTSPATVSAVDMRIVNQSTVGKSVASSDLSTWIRVRTVHNSIQ